ncbi:response regulator transcription factor [Mucilaginibacter defluvii]|uniref:LuxR C-terminal-related transcriptional regulator n=1 Tax=Mucilaginibacter defluvii TaxID=1196019 RepID=A0ABP9FLN3_9SPHI
MRNLLDIKLFSQNFDTANAAQQLENARSIARLYTGLENGISVLSDMNARKSYLYYGSLTEQIGLERKAESIDTIWEDDLLNRVHPDDLQKKYRLEFSFFKLLQAVPVAERTDYGLITRLRIRDNDEQYITVQHRLIYIGSSANGSIWLALCLYNRVYDHPGFDAPAGVIVNNRTGKVVEDDGLKFNGLLSEREKEVLQLIKLGRRSKEIAEQLSLSINTVNRHRQNIFEKLNVSNAMEACRMAGYLGC